MPRAAVLSIHARVDGTAARHVGGPVARAAVGAHGSAPTCVRGAETARCFRSGSCPPMTPRADAVAEDLASRLDVFLDGRRMDYGEAGRRARARTRTRCATPRPTGRVLIRWDGARQPTIWTVPPPAVGPDETPDSNSPVATCTCSDRPRRAGLRSMGRDRGRRAAAPPSTRSVGIADAGAHARRRCVDPDRGRGRRSARRSAPWRRLPGCYPAGTRTTSCRAPIGSCWSRIRIAALSSGPRESGRAPSSWAATSSGPGDGHRPTSASPHGDGSRGRSGRRWKRRLRRCRCPASRARCESGGTADGGGRYWIRTSDLTDVNRAL